jgi:hypothetical protein
MQLPSSSPTLVWRLTSGPRDEWLRHAYTSRPRAQLGSLKAFFLFALLISGRRTKGSALEKKKNMVPLWRTVNLQPANAVLYINGSTHFPCWQQNPIGTAFTFPLYQLLCLLIDLMWLFLLLRLCHRYISYSGGLTTEPHRSRVIATGVDWRLASQCETFHRPLVAGTVALTPQFRLELVLTHLLCARRRRFRELMRPR